MASSYWRVCFVGADGEWICEELYAKLPPEWDDLLDERVRTELEVLAGVDAAAARTADVALRGRLVDALDEAAVRLNEQLAEGIVLRRAEVIG